MVPLLSVKELCKEFRAGGLWGGKVIRALDQVDLDVRPGDTLGLVGESGCGKTTLARCAVGLTEPTSGSVIFDGHELRFLSRESLRRKRREFQIVFQDAYASLDPNMNVRQILSEPFESHGLGTRRQREEWIGDLAGAVSLDLSLLSRLPASLSGGQQQRVGLARALALRPRLLVADEPVSSLDASVQAQILNLLVDLQSRFGLTLILISHSLQVVHYVCSRVAVMYLGRIVEEASTASFFSGPKHPYSQLLLRCIPSFGESRDGSATNGGVELPTAAALLSGCAFQTRCPRVHKQCLEQRPNLDALDSASKVACFLYTSGRSPS